MQLLRKTEVLLTESQVQKLKEWLHQPEADLFRQCLLTRALDSGVNCFNALADAGPDKAEWDQNRAEVQRALELVQLLTDFATGNSEDGDIKYAKTTIQLDV